MLTVACVLKSGGIYDASWVARLRNGVTRHLPIEHRFVCLSDVDVPCERIPLEHDWPGWWSKIEALRLPGPMLFLDLDTVVVGDLTDVAQHVGRADFTMLRDFYAPVHVGSGVMAWAEGGGPLEHIYTEFARDPQTAMITQRTRMGDQAFIECMHPLDRVLRWQDFVGDQIVSYKVHCRNGIPSDARVICLHGRPKFADMPANDPVRLAWEACA